MSIYSPVSSATNALMSVGGSILGGVAGKLGAGFGSSFGGRLGAAAVSAATHAVSRRVAGVIQPMANKVDSWINKQYNKMMGKVGLNIFSEDVDYADGALNVAGGMAFKDMWEIVQATDAYTLSRKNFYVLEISDRSYQSPTAKDGKYSLFHLLTTNLSFSSVTIGGEAVQLGSVEIDHLQSSARTEMTLSCYDDAMGTIKNWAKGRANATAPSDGTFGIPFLYLFDVKVIFGTNVENSDYYNETFTMRLSDLSHELDRSSQALEVVSLKFTQWDTCMPAMF
jgi:hypothetical protein